MIFTLRQLQEKCREQKRPLYVAFYDLTKAFDSVHREMLWCILRKYGCPEKFVSILRLLHENMNAVVICNNSTTDPFPVNVGVKQGCVIAPTLFSLFLGATLQLIDQKDLTGVELVYRVDGKLFNISRLKARTKVTPITVIELQYADDAAACSCSEGDLQRITDAFCTAYSRLGLTLNTTKTEVLYQPPPNYPEVVGQPRITVNDSALAAVGSFKYLGHRVTTKGTLDCELENRICSAAAAFGRLDKRVFSSHDLQRDTKLLVYNAIVIPTLLYGAETWTTYRRHIKALEQYHQRCLRRILGITWEDRRTNISVLQDAKTTSIEAMITQHRLRWAGHLARMDNSRLAKQVFYSQLKEGKRGVGRPLLRYKDILKCDLSKCGLDTNNWESAANDRGKWRRAVHVGVERFEADRIRQAEEARRRRKLAAAAAATNPSTTAAGGMACAVCGKICRARIGLLSHLRTHQS